MFFLLTFLIIMFGMGQVHSTRNRFETPNMLMHFSSCFIVLGILATTATTTK
jgi:hypothetical protein